MVNSVLDNTCQLIMVVIVIIFFLDLCMSLTSVKLIPFQAESRRVMLKTTVHFVFLAYFS